MHPLKSTSQRVTSTSTKLPSFFLCFRSTIRESTCRMIGCGGLIYCRRRKRSAVAVLRIEAADRYFVEALIAYEVQTAVDTFR